MKPTFEQINETAASSFVWRQYSKPRFDAPFHFHPELELTLILQGSGRRLVGRQVSNFGAGDLVLLGPNLPHVWLNGETTSTAEAVSEAVVIQFKENFVGEQFWAMPEMVAIQSLLRRAKSGLSIKGKTRDWAAQKMSVGPHLSPFEKLLHLMELLHYIAVSDETEPIDLHFSMYAPSSAETERFQKVYAYLMEHYREAISLDTIAAVANLSPSSFCRFFKKTARMTFVDALTEFRVKHAAQLLSSTEKPIADICFESGFGNVSYFNTEFKKSLGQSPMQYRKAHL
jgi:AraC-like DNA-binding protein